MLHAVSVPLASSWSELEDLPALLVWDYMLYQAGIADAREWLDLEARRSH